MLKDNVNCSPASRDTTEAGEILTIALAVPDSICEMISDSLRTRFQTRTSSISPRKAGQDFQEVPYHVYSLLGLMLGPLYRGAVHQRECCQHFYHLSNSVLHHHPPGATTCCHSLSENCSALLFPICEPVVLNCMLPPTSV